MSKGELHFAPYIKQSLPYNVYLAAGKNDTSISKAAIMSFLKADKPENLSMLPNLNYFFLWVQHFADFTFRTTTIKLHFLNFKNIWVSICPGKQFTIVYNNYCKYIHFTAQYRKKNQQLFLAQCVNITGTTCVFLKKLLAVANA